MPTIVVDPNDYDIPVKDLKRLLKDTEYLQDSDMLKLKKFRNESNDYLVVTDSKEDGNQILLFSAKTEVESYIRSEQDDNWWIEHIYHGGIFYSYDIQVSIYPETMKVEK